LLLLVDGVNELPSDRGRAQVNQFRELFQKTCPMIFTTRELSAGGDLGIAKRLEMQPLTEPQMQQFVMAYLPTQGERLLRQLSGRLREFGQTPLLLWMLCSLFQQSEQIPPNLGMVFRAFTVGYGDRIKQDVTLSKDSRAWWGRLLQYLAFKMTCGESLTDAQVAISRRDAEQFLLEFLRGKVEFADDLAVRWLEDLLKHHLIQISNDRIEFRHQLIQEYYAAEWLLGLLPSLSDARLQHDYLNYLKWTEPLALMLELVEGEEQAVRVVRLGMEVDLRLGARLAGAVKYGFQEKTVGLLVQEIDERKIPNLFAIELFGETRSDVAIKFLIQTEDNRYIFWKTSEALVKIRSNKAIEVLIQCLKSKDSYVRINVVDALGRIGSRKAIEPLIQALNDEDSYVRINAVGALGKIGDDKAVEFLIQSLKDENSFVCINAAGALGRIGGDKVVESLIQSLDDEYAEVRWNSAEILGDIGSDKGIIPLIRLFKDQDFDVRRNATEALVKIGSNKVIKHLIQVLQDEDYRVRLRAEWTLSKIVDGKPVELLFKELKDENSNVICHSLASASNKAIESLLFSLRTNETDLRKIVTEILGKNSSDGNIESPMTFESLIQVSKDINSEIEDNLVEIVNTEVIEVSIKALKDEKSYVRVAAVEELEKIAKDARNLPILTQQLPHLRNLIFTESSQQALSVITTIQARCKYYNYDIAQTPLQETENHVNPVERILKEIHQTLKIMSETGKYNFKADVVQIIENNSGEVIGKNHANDPALLQTINEITQVLANLQNAHPTATEAEAKDIIEAEFKEIQNNQPNRWTTFRQQLLNPERWLNGGKTTISEITKHYAENNVFLIAGVAFLDGFSTDEE
jgi:HEAT repeat protein